MPFSDAKKIYLEALRHFTNSTGNPTWWWEYFRKELPKASRSGDEEAWKQIVSVVPDPDVKAWFIPEDDENLVYLACPRVIQKIIGNSSPFEYYIVDNQFKWLLCETHHDDFIGVGEPVAANIAKLG